MTAMITKHRIYRGRLITSFALRHLIGHDTGAVVLIA